MSIDHPLADKRSPDEMRRPDARLVHLTPLKSRSSACNQFYLLRAESMRVAQFVIHIEREAPEFFVGRVYARMWHRPELERQYMEVQVSAYSGSVMSISIVVHLNPLFHRVYNGVDLFCHYMRELRRREYTIIGTEHSATPISDASEEVTKRMHRFDPSFQRFMSQPAFNKATTCNARRKRSLSSGTGESLQKKFELKVEAG